MKERIDRCSNHIGQNNSNNKSNNNNKNNERARKHSVTKPRGTSNVKLKAAITQHKKLQKTKYLA